MDGKWCFDSCAYELATLDLRDLMDLAARRRDALESHIPRGAIGAQVDVDIINCEKAILEGGADEAVRLTIPEECPWVDHLTTWHVKATHIVSGRRVAATINARFPSNLSPIADRADLLHSKISIFTPVYSCGPNASPSDRSWSMHGWPSFGL